MLSCVRVVIRLGALIFCNVGRSHGMNKPQMNFVALVQAVLDGYALDWNGIHGITHWTRVLENGLRLAAKTGADPAVITLFAVFHDARRINDGHDPDHGARGAQLAAGLRGTLFEIDDHAFGLLHHACTWHTAGLIDADLTVQCCWDADRLDLGRVWIEPDPRYLCTEAARNKSTRRWADGRARMDFVPDVIKPLWEQLSTAES
jgi:uncharacterized protein